MNKAAVILPSRHFNLERGRAEDWEGVMRAQRGRRGPQVREEAGGWLSQAGGPEKHGVGAAEKQEA